MREPTSIEWERWNEHTIRSTCGRFEIRKRMASSAAGEKTADYVLKADGKREPWTRLCDAKAAATRIAGRNKSE